MKRINTDLSLFGPLGTKLYEIHVQTHIDGLVQERRNSIVYALYLRLSCTKSPVYFFFTKCIAEYYLQNIGRFV